MRVEIFIIFYIREKVYGIPALDLSFDLTLRLPLSAFHSDTQRRGSSPLSEPIRRQDAQILPDDLRQDFFC